MPPFPDRCPTELIASILCNCASLGDLKALILTCRRIHAVWLAHAPHVIATLGPSAVVAFDVALVAARAINLVHQAELAGELPPAIDPRALSARATLPVPREFSTVMDLVCFVDCIQARYCGMFTLAQADEEAYYAPQGRWPADRYEADEFADPCEPEEPEGMPRWTERFRRAAYTALLLGALLARAYQEPFARRPRREDEGGEPWSVFHSDVGDEFDHVERIEVEHLCRFPVFDFLDKRGGHEAAFGDIARWLIESTLERIRREPLVTECPSRSLTRPRAHWEDDEEDGDDEAEWIGGAEPPTTDLFDEFPHGSPAEAEGVVWFLMQLVHMFEFLLDSITLDELLPSYLSPNGAHKPITPPRTVNVVLLGFFRTETVTLFDDPYMTSRRQLDIRPAGDCENRLAKLIHIHQALGHVYCRGGAPNIVDDSEAPPPPLQFFTYALREHFGLRFRRGTFEMTRETPRQPYREFKARAAIFANHFDDVPRRAWYDKERGIERRILDVANGTEILEKHGGPGVSGVRRMLCDPRAFDTFEFFQQMGIYDTGMSEDEEDEGYVEDEDEDDENDDEDDEDEEDEDEHEHEE